MTTEYTIENNGYTIDLVINHTESKQRSHGTKPVVTKMTITANDKQITQTDLRRVPIVALIREALHDVQTDTCLSNDQHIQAYIIYTNHKKRGGRKPTLEVMNAFNISRQTARRWVRQGAEKA